MFKRLLLAYLIALPVLPALGQDTTFHRMAVNAAIHKGFLIAHRPMVVPLQQDHITGIETSLLIKTDGSRQWQQVYGYPEMGLSVAIWDLGNSNQLGTGVSLIPYLDFPLARGKKSSFDLKFGWGIGYIQKTFDADNNYKNVAIGSHLNCALTLQPRFKTRISEHLEFNGGLSLSHFSNGSVATPNLGLNLASVTGGLAYTFGPEKSHVPAPLPPFLKSSRWTFFAGAAIKQVYPADGKNYLAGSVSGNKSWQISRKSAFGVGLDFFYDRSIDQKLEEQNLELNNQLEAYRYGLYGSYEMVISDLSVIIHLGGYLYTKLDNDGTFYQRVGLRYRATEKIFVLMQLKSHWGKADFIEWGLGYRIDKQKSK